MAWKFAQSGRAAMIADICSRPLDLLVIGGGVTGAGILLDAHTRGMRAAVVEMQDFAAGTSSRSTKLVHGGLRYLKQFDLKLVAEVGRERAIVYENGPHVTTPLWMLLPIVEHGTYGRLMSAVGLSLYDRLAGVKASERHTMLTAEQALAKEPLLSPSGLKGAGYYVEYRTDDARLTLEIIKEAVARGAAALNYMKAEAFIYNQGKVAGAQVRDRLTGDSYTLAAKKVVNAAGPWVDLLRDMDHSKQGKTIHLTKGTHIVIAGERFPLRNPVYFDVPDGRMVFAIPRAGKTYIGTTDTDYCGDPQEPAATSADRDYLVDCVNAMFPAVALTARDVESFWAGVRPLIHEDGKSPSEISRKDEVFVADSGLVTIAGGKLTGYRRMADKVVSLVAAQLQAEERVQFPGCMTASMEISGGKFGGSANVPAFLADKTAEGIALGLGEKEAETLARRYGTNVDRVHDVIRNQGQEAGVYSLSLDVYAALVYAINAEMLATPADFFIRRTSALFFDSAWVRKWKEPVIRYLAQHFQWDAALAGIYAQELEAQLQTATTTCD